MKVNFYFICVVVFILGEMMESDEKTMKIRIRAAAAAERNEKRRE
jgi:hypothetical protein